MKKKNKILLFSGLFLLVILCFISGYDKKRQAKQDYWYLYTDYFICTYLINEYTQSIDRSNSHIQLSYLLEIKHKATTSIKLYMRSDFLDRNENIALFAFTCSLEEYMKAVIPLYQNESITYDKAKNISKELEQILPVYKVITNDYGETITALDTAVLNCDHDNPIIAQYIDYMYP